MNRAGDGSSTQACAVCKHRRKRCPEECEIAPYFPASKFDEFQNAYKLFGVSNIKKILRSVPPEHKKSAADSILLDGYARANDPVHDCQGIVRGLRSEIEFIEKELKSTKELIAYYRGIEQQKEQHEKLRSSSSSTPPLIPKIEEEEEEEEEAKMVDGVLDFLPSSPAGSDGKRKARASRKGKEKMIKIEDQGS